jgi:hypothetical protein
MRSNKAKIGEKIVPSDYEEVKKEIILDEKVPLLLIINVKKETAMHNIITAEEVKEEAKMLEDKLRPTVISRMSHYYSELEVLFAPLSNFKIDTLPKKVKLDDGFEYYEIKLEYIETFISTQEILIMNVNNAFK